MKKQVLIILGIIVSIYMIGCSKKQTALEQLQEPMSKETLNRLNLNNQTTLPEVETNMIEVPAVETKLEPLPPAGPYKPANQEIQTALKNAGYYTGQIDGKIGPVSKKAIEDFQKANGLAVDGKVGLKTWQLLSSYLNPPVISQPEPKLETTTKSKKKKKQ